MEIKVKSISFHPNGYRAASIQIIFKVRKDEDYKKMLAVIFYDDKEDEYVWNWDTLIHVTNLDEPTEALDPEFFKLLHVAVCQWQASRTGGGYTQSFPFTVNDKNPSHPIPKTYHPSENNWEHEFR